MPVCITVTLLDGLVLARSIFNHSMNYRSVVILGKATLVDDPQEKLEALRILSEHILPGRWEESRQPNERELKQTSVLRVPIEEFSAKVRTGPPIDDEEDYAFPTWAGVVPLEMKAGTPIDDARLLPRKRSAGIRQALHAKALGKGLTPKVKTIILTVRANGKDEDTPAQSAAKARSPSRKRCGNASAWNPATELNLSWRKAAPCSALPGRKKILLRNIAVFSARFLAAKRESRLGSTTCAATKK